MPAITSIRFRRGTAAQWASVNPVLSAGEMGLETDTRKFKFGNGSLQWNSISYASAVGTKGEGFIISETAPVGPDIGDVWYCNDTTGDLAGRSFIRYDGYWVEINPGTLGPKGDAGTIAVGTVTTGAPGSSATITNVGTASSATLNFAIPRGDVGATGATGSTGATGAAATIAVGTTTTGAAGSSATVTNSGTSGAATFNFTIPRGDTGATGATGAKGDKGDTGNTGATGSAATVAAGTTTTGAAGSSASVTNAGTSSAAVFNFTIPRGDTGATGATGPANTLTVSGTTTGAAGSSASVTVSGTAPNQSLAFTIPRGDTGATGATGSTGAAGAAATIAVGTTTTGAAGSSATVTNSGTSSAAVFDFTIPVGATGATGATGNTGATGSQGPSGVIAVTSPITNSGTSTSATIGIDQTLLAINMKQIATTVSDKASGYTIQAVDENTFIRSTSATAVTMTIANVLNIGESVQFIQFGAGQITFAAGAGVALRSVDNKLKSNKQYSVVAITCVASGEYLVTGDVAA